MIDETARPAGSAEAGRGALIDRFRRARRDRTLAVVEGFHALKHALRFDAEILAALCTDAEGLQRLSSELAPDLAARLPQLVEAIDEQAFATIAPKAPRTGVIALARRRGESAESLLRARRHAPTVLLEEPRDMGNVGACVRVAAAAAAAGVIVTGRHDPWHADAIRGAAGLHFALPVIWIPTLPPTLPGLPEHAHPLLAMDPDGEPMRARELPADAVIAFGSERRGLSEELRASADATLRIPMAPGVSSLNLATSVAAVLFGMRLCA